MIEASTRADRRRSKTAPLFIVGAAMALAALATAPIVSSTPQERACSNTYVRSTPMWQECVRWRTALHGFDVEQPRAGSRQR